ncbi:MAG: HlyD family secretion protein [Acidobacteriota bacterium]|jgi:HlyD family secretion protein|nr:HlyD family secretion protein [Acidobacteriota bacterium]
MDPLENNHKQRRWLIAAIVLVAGVLVALFFFRRGKDDGGGGYRTEVIDRGSVTMTVSATGTVSPVTTVQVGSQVSGIVAKLYADFNSQVKKGQLLAELDPTPLLQQVEQRQADVTKSQVEVSNQQIVYGRQKRLAAAGLIAQADLDAAKAGYDAARAQLNLSKASLRQAQTNLGYTKIYSPIDGQVVARQYDIGQTVAASFQAPTLFTIAQDLTKMQVQADVDQSDIGQIKAGEVARFTVDAYPDQEFRGQISQVRLNATVTQNVITYPVIIEVPNPEGKLRPSMTANVTVEVATVRDVLRVPNAALRFKPAGQEAAATPGGSQGARGAGRRSGGTTSGGGGTTAGGGAPSGAAGGGAAGGGSFERSVADRSAGGLGSAVPGGGRRGGRGQGQTVYVLSEVDKKTELRPVRLRTGISDGHYTEVVRVYSGTLNPGDKVVTGMATVKVEQSPGQTNPLGGRPPGGGGGRRF